MLQRHLDMVEEMLTTLATSPLLFSPSQVIKIPRNSFFSPDEDWDRMEALADQELEQAEYAEVCVESSVREESLAKLAAFKENPHVDLNESKLATELKAILEEAQRRMEAGELEKKRKKEEKKVRMAEEAAKNTKDEI